jgi:hypothetical protein
MALSLARLGGSRRKLLVMIPRSSMSGRLISCSSTRAIRNPGRFALSCWIHGSFIALLPTCVYPSEKGVASGDT